jgi:hypothetical protein
MRALAFIGLSATRAPTHVPHSVPSCGFRGFTGQRRRAHDNPLRRQAALRARGDVIAFSNSPSGFEMTAFRAFIVINWHGLRSARRLQKEPALNT